MAKIDKSLYSKEEWQRIRDQRRREKDEDRAEKERVEHQKKSQELRKKEVLEDDKEKRYILCMKHGDKYSHEYVNRLYNMCKRHCKLDFEFVCVTENSRNINPEITILPLPSNLKGWWVKPYMFSPDLKLNGTILYMDLDVVIANNIDHLFTWNPKDWCIIRDFTRKMRPHWRRYNSSIIRFNSNQLAHIWNEFKREPEKIMRRFHGDQDFIWDADQKGRLWPDRWILSWKWEVRKTKNYAPGGTRGNRKLALVEDVTPPPDCAICVFHGDPNPHNCDDPWVKKNWT